MPCQVIYYLETEVNNVLWNFQAEARYKDEPPNNNMRITKIEYWEESDGFQIGEKKVINYDSELRHLANLVEEAHDMPELPFVDSAWMLY